MKTDIDITADQRRIILHLVHVHLPDVDVWAYGSRVNGNARPHSDLDLVAFTAPNRNERVADLRHAFEESDLPFKIDLFAWDDLPESFHRHIERAYVVLQHGEPDARRPADEWRAVTLGDCAVINDATYSPKEAWPVIHYLDTGNVTDNHIAAIRRLVPGTDKIPSRARRKVQPGDIVYSTVRPDQRHFGLLKDPPDNLLVSTAFAVIRGKAGVAHTDFLYWFLAQRHVVERLHTIAEHSVSAYPSIRPDDIARLELRLPPLPEQRRIAHILGTLDDKIALNRRLNATLEDMARALFKSWFVDFDPVHAKAALKRHARSPVPELVEGLKGDKTGTATWTVERARAYLDGMDPEIAALFPDEFEKSAVGPIPRRWALKKLKEFGTIVTGKTPDTHNSAFYGADVPFLKIPDMHKRMYVVRTHTMLSYAGASSQPTKALPPGSISMSCIATPGLVVINHKETHTNQQINSIVPNDRRMIKYLYWACRGLSAEILAGGSGGSVFGNMNKSTFSNLSILDSGPNLIRWFEEMSHPIHEIILSHEKEICILTSVRDTLLLRLISDELEYLSNLERDIHEPSGDKSMDNKRSRLWAST